jgi:hypothetical protein
MNKFYTLVLTIIFFNTTNVFSQLNIKVKIENISVMNTVDCDAGASDNSDFLFEFNATDNSVASLTNNAPVAGSIGMCNMAYVNENNGPYSIVTNTPGLAVFSPTSGVFFDHSYNCYQNIPTALTLVWRGYENDDVAYPSTTPIASGITTINTATVALTSNVTSTTQTVQYTSTSSDGGCPQTYQITFSIMISTGSFYPLFINDVGGSVICPSGTNGMVEGTIIGGSGTVLIDWSNDGLGDFNDLALVSGLSAGSYTLIVKDALNCRDTMVTSITTTPPPSAISAFSVSTSSVCSGQMGVVYAVNPAGNADTYNWAYSGTNSSLSNSIVPTASNSISINYMSGATSGILSVYAQNTCSTSPTLTLAITVNATPTVVIGGNSSMCDNAQETLIATGGQSYVWNTGATTSSIAISPSVTSIYSVTASNNGCSSSGQYTMNVINSPTLSVSGPTQAVCPNQTVTLNTAGNGNLYLWSDGFIGNTNSVFSPVTTIFTVTATYTNSCYTQNTFTLNVSPNPTITISGTTIACPGKTVSLTASGTDTYNWSNGVNTNVNTFIATGLSTLTVTGTNTITGCSQTKTVSVNTYPAGLVSISGNSVVCSTSSSIYTANGSTYYLWNDGATANTNTISATTSTTISVIGTTANGCKDSASLAITVLQTPTLSVAGTDSICSGQSATMTVTASSATSYSWSSGATTANTSVNPTTTTVYSVTAFNGSCGATQTHQVAVKASPIIVFSLKSVLCSNGPVFTLTATPTGGMFNGTSVTGNSFDPSVGAGLYPITYSITGSNGCSASHVETQEVVVCDGIAEINKTISIDVYPNPATDEFNIKSDISINLIEILDFTGKVVKRVIANSQQEIISVNDLAAGLYVCKLTMEGGVQRTIKLVKK